MIPPSVAGSGLTGGGGADLDVAVDNATLELNSDTLRVKALGVDAGHLANDLWKYADIQLTNAEMLALRATPKTLIAAPGANKAILVHKIHAVCDAAAGAYTESADNIVLEYADGTDIMTLETTGWIDQAAVSPRIQAPDQHSALVTPVANSAVQLKNSGDGEFGGGNAANTFSIRVYYSIVDTVAFT